jgi:trehalose 6-phosphate synthase
MTDLTLEEMRQHCKAVQARVLSNRSLIVAANRAPVTFEVDEHGAFQPQRGGGGLVTALLGLCQHSDVTWVGCARTEADAAWREGKVTLPEGGSIQVRFLSPELPAYEGYYNVIANPLLWFLQHSMWNVSRAPVINRATWRAWEDGYVAVNRLFAEAIARQVLATARPTLVMLQDYHLYLVPRFLRSMLKPRERPTLLHFVHIPWPGEYWRLLPPTMRQAILDGLCAVDLLGFQTREDALNFIRTCQSLLPRASVNFKRGWVWYRNHATYVRDFPISIDVDALRAQAESPEIAQYQSEIQAVVGNMQLVLRIDRIEPSKNIIRGFQAFEEMLELYPEHAGKVVFLALLMPSRLEVDEYQSYLDELMAAAGRVNARHGSSAWEPVRVLVGENYVRAVAALQRYDVLLVNSIVDGMNLVAKEGPIVNQRAGVLVLSERTGARQQLEPGAIVISPCDVYATAEALHQALGMSLSERQERATRLRWSVEREDIAAWLCGQLESIVELNL